MTVKELKAILDEIPQNMEIVFKPQNSDYVEDFSSSYKTKEVRSFWGSDFNSIVICSDGQAGMI